MEYSDRADILSDVMEATEEAFEKYGITLTPEQEQKVSDALWQTINEATKK